jgi:hypothetical protein
LRATSGADCTIGDIVDVVADALLGKSGATTTHGLISGD